MMAREEAIEIFEQKGWWIAQKETLTSKQAEEIIKLNDAVNFALSALRPISREQVEKMWRGKWKHYLPPFGAGNIQHRCTKCGRTPDVKTPFCAWCGAPMTDEAVEMVIKRINEMEEIKK